MATQSRNYAENATLLKEIAASKRTYCSTHTDRDWDYSMIVADLSEVHNPWSGMVVRVMTDEHIYVLTRMDSRGIRQKRHKTNFPPFKHYRYTGVRWVEALRSHWHGSIAEGHFDTRHGRLTDGLGSAIYLITTNYARKSNWRGYSYNDEMVSNGIEQLSQHCLKFREDMSGSQKPFAYFTAILTRAFLDVKAHEENQANIRGSIRASTGDYQPTYSEQAQMELDRLNQVATA